MLAQYYKGEGFIRIFPDKNSHKIVDIPTRGNAPSNGNVKNTLKQWGFPPISKWEKLTWGYQLEFEFMVVQTELQ